MKAICNDCGLPFPIRNFSVKNAQYVEFSGIVQQCPYCGGEGEIEQGVFSFDEKGIATKISLLNVPVNTLIEFKELAEKAQKEKYSPEKFKAETLSIGIPASFFTSVVIPQDSASFWTFMTVLVAAIIGAIQILRKDPPQVIHHHHYYSAQPKNKRELTEDELQRKKLKEEKRQARKDSKKFKNKKR